MFHLIFLESFNVFKQILDCISVLAFSILKILKIVFEFEWSIFPRKWCVLCNELIDVLPCLMIKNENINIKIKNIKNALVI